jgi:hypothetical protein
MHYPRCVDGRWEIDALRAQSKHHMGPTAVHVFVGRHGVDALAIAHRADKPARSDGRTEAAIFFRRVVMLPSGSQVACGRHA